MPTVSVELMTDDSSLLTSPRQFKISEATAQYFYNSVYAYVVKGSPRANASSFPRPADNAFLAGMLIQQMELFVMAHEVAHFTKGHLKQAPQNQSEAWTREYEADETALTLVSNLAHDNGYSWAIGAWACDVVFGLFHLLGSAVATMAYGRESLRWISRTHPSPLRRQQNLRKRMVSLVQDFSWNRLVLLDALDSITQAMLNELWGLILPNLLDEYKKSLRPSPVWKGRSQSDFGDI
jgi:hypothetical protein